MKHLAEALSRTFGQPFSASPGHPAPNDPGTPGATQVLADEYDPAGGSGFDDMVSDDLDGDGLGYTDGGAATPAAPAGNLVYKENCRKCRGTGKYAFFSSLGHADCTQCKGRGFHEYRTSPEHRANERAKAGAAKQRKAEREAAERAELAAAWGAANPGEHAWLKDNADRNEFAASLSASLLKWGSLTENQLRAVRNGMAREADRAAAQAKVVAEAKSVDVAEIERVFARAAGNGLKRPKLLLDEFTFKQASALGRNPGALYVTRSKGDEYLGKVADGKFIKSRDCNDLDEAAILAACADPRAAALRYGRLTGSCSVCARKLVDPTSVEAGIGPICAAKYGF